MSRHKTYILFKDFEFTHLTHKYFIFCVYTCVKSVHTEKYAPILCTICTLKTVQKLSLERWNDTSPLNQWHIGDVVS